MNVLIVEDDAELASFLEQAVTEEGYATLIEGDGCRAYELAQTLAFDLILLDVMLPGMDGFTVCQLLRAVPIVTPILLITARDALVDRVEGLDSGADDYLVKPFLLDELLARMRALLRRGQMPSLPLRVADLTLDTVTRRAYRDGAAITLSATEYTLLECLMRHAGHVVPRATLLETVWQYDFNGNDNILEVYIRHLRNKLDRGRTPGLIRTVRGVGYRIDRSSGREPDGDESK